MSHELMSGHFGNGLAIWREGTNDIVAHIDYMRIIKLRVPISTLSKEELSYIKCTAAYDDRNISTTQDEKVFEIRPIDINLIEIKQCHMN